jgi:hypothetical protein
MTQPSFTPCESCRREHRDQIELLEQRLSREHPRWSRVRVRARAAVEYAKGVREGKGIVRFFTGLHQPSDAQHFAAAFVSVNRLRNRKSGFVVGDWIMDSGAFSEISTHGHYRHPVSEYAAQIRRWKDNGNLLAAVSQDFMCEPWIVAKVAGGALWAWMLSKQSRV